MSSLARIPEGSAGEPAAARLAQAERFLRDALGRPGEGERLRVVALGAPAAPATSILDAVGGGSGLLFDAPGEGACAAAGVAAEIRVRGEGRVAALREASAALFAGIREVRGPGAAVTPPRLYGGLSFAPGLEHGGVWEGFGDGLFMLPRWVYSTRGGRASLALALASDAPSAAIDEALAELRAIWGRLLAGELDTARAAPRARSITHLPLEAWREQVEAIRAAIRAGAVTKVVAARRATVELDRAASPAAILDQLRARFPLCTSFALLRGGAAFLGATPEKLVERRGSVVSTEALAGSIARGRADDLLASRKDLEEHRLVVDAIVEGLRPLCTQVSVESEPRIRELPDLLHMQTPIEGRAREGVDVLALVEALHPTPAVGGVPTIETTRWIAAHEPEPRGWYSAPFGWFDASGDGAFVVALRSGLLRGDRAFVYAGAGIMEDSDPLSEYEETALKMQALLGALDEDQGA